MRFKAKKDLMYGVILLAIGFSAVIFGVAFPFFSDADLVSNLVIFIVSFPVGVYCIWCWFGTSYWISESQLIIKQGPFRRTINIGDIEKIEKNKNPLVASTALSLESYILQYSPYKFLIISPENIEEFVAKLDEINDHKHIKFMRD